MGWRECCHAAIASLDEVLAERPGKLHQELVEAVRDTVAVRDALIREGEHGRLDRLNSILSLLVGAEYPLVGVRWERVKQAREGLAEFVETPGPA